MMTMENNTQIIVSFVGLEYNIDTETKKNSKVKTKSK